MTSPMRSLAWIIGLLLMLGLSASKVLSDNNSVSPPYDSSTSASSNPTSNGGTRDQNLHEPAGSGAESVESTPAFTRKDCVETCTNNLKYMREHSPLDESMEFATLMLRSLAYAYRANITMRDDLQSEAPCKSINSAINDCMDAISDCDDALKLRPNDKNVKKAKDNALHCLKNFSSAQKKRLNAAVPTLNEFGKGYLCGYNEGMVLQYEAFLQLKRHDLPIEAYAAWEDQELVPRQKLAVAQSTARLEKAYPSIIFLPACFKLGYGEGAIAGRKSAYKENLAQLNGNEITNNESTQILKSSLELAIYEYAARIGVPAAKAADVIKLESHYKIFQASNLKRPE